MDEIAEIDSTLQVKLLRVLQTREFVRLGDSAPQRFAGRLISATHRDLAQEIEAGRFREDLYYRLNADHVVTPSLFQILQGTSEELHHLLRYVAEWLLPSTAEHEQDGAQFADELLEWIEKHLGLDYAWPGNFRELEQCARAFLIRGHYEPTRSAGLCKQNWLDRARSSQLSADELLNAYCTQVYDEVGSFEGAARKLGLDRRTVRARTQS